MNPHNITWHELLIQGGIEPSSAMTLISFISWNTNTEYPHLGEKITNIISSYSGRIIVKDAISSKHGDKGLLFFSEDLHNDIVTDIFNIIMNYEHENIYTS